MPIQLACAPQLKRSWMERGSGAPPRTAHVLHVLHDEGGVPHPIALHECRHSMWRSSCTSAAKRGMAGLSWRALFHVMHVLAQGVLSTGM